MGLLSLLPFPSARRDAIEVTLGGALLAGLAFALRLHGPFVAGVLVALACLSFLLTLRALRFDHETVAIVGCAVVLYLLYLGYTDYGERNYDGAEELAYVRYIVDHHAIPPAGQCFVCHHPPGYYLVAAVAYVFFARTHLLPPTVGVQVASLAVFLPLLLFATLLARRFSHNPRHHHLVAAIVALWPYTVTSSVRLHNDTLANSIMVAGVYWAVRYHQGGRTRELLVTAAVAAAAVLTKSNGYILVALLGVTVLLRARKAPCLLRHLGRAATVFALLGGVMSVNALRQAHLAPVAATETRGALCEKVMGTACRIGKHEFVGNGPKNYLWFDVPGFLREPYLVAARDDTGRQLFWNDLLKTSLFGTNNTLADRETGYDLNAAFARVMSALMLAMIAYAVVGLAALPRDERRRHGILALAGALFLAFAVAFRALIPAPHHNDFRHVFPLLVIAAVLYASATASLGRFGRWAAAPGPLLAASLSALSIVYFWPKYDWAMALTARTIPMSLADVSRVLPEGTQWDRLGNKFFDANHTFEFALPAPTKVSTVDTSVDSNDRYEIKLVGATETRRLVVGPKKVKGLARYIEAIRPPVAGVTRVTIHPISGDLSYSLGHLLVR